MIAYAFPSESVGVEIAVFPKDCLSQTCRIVILARFGGTMYQADRVGDDPNLKPFCEQTYTLQVSSRVDYHLGDCYDNLLQKRSQSDHLIYPCDADSAQGVHEKPFIPTEFDCVCKEGYRAVGACAGTVSAVECMAKRHDVHWRKQVWATHPTQHHHPPWYPCFPSPPKLLFFILLFCMSSWIVDYSSYVPRSKAGAPFLSATESITKRLHHGAIKRFVKILEWMWTKKRGGQKQLRTHLVKPFRLRASRFFVLLKTQERGVGTVPIS